MVIESEFRNKLNAIVETMPAPYREQLKREIDILLTTGMKSYAEMLATINNHLVSDEIRKIATWLAPKIGDSRGTDALLLASNDGNAEIRRYALQALGELYIQSSQIFQTITNAADGDSNPDVRKAAVYSLGLMGNMGASKVLTKTLINKEEVPEVRGMAAEAIASLRDISAIPILIEALSDQMPDVRFWSAYALRCIGDESALEALDKILKTDDAEIPSWGSIRAEAGAAINAILKRGQLQNGGHNTDLKEAPNN